MSTDVPLLFLFEIMLMLSRINYLMGNLVPVLTPVSNAEAGNSTNREHMNYLPFLMMIDKNKDTSEFWRETEILSLVRENLDNALMDQCRLDDKNIGLVSFPSRRVVRPICRGPIEIIQDRAKSPCFCKRLKFNYGNQFCHCDVKKKVNVKSRRRKKIIKRLTGAMQGSTSSLIDYFQLCPQCPHFNNYTECELFRDSCRERKVLPTENQSYCNKKYGQYRTMFIPADYSKCRCCDECVFYRELDQSCMEDEYSFDSEEFLPVTSIDFRAGCNPYWGHPEQELRALRCDNVLRRCVPVSVPAVPKESLLARRNFRYEPPTGGSDCPVSCRGYECKDGKVNETRCRPGAFLPDKDSCNCCGRCSTFKQINEKCAEFKKTIHFVNGTKEIEVEEEFLEPGCDDGLVCRQGRCQDIHSVRAAAGSRRKRDQDDLDANVCQDDLDANEPCKRELKFFKKKYGPDGHLHYDAPQCTPLWLYAPVQCRRFVCYCALEDGTFIQGIKVPRVEVTNMNCDCARDKCRTGSDVECDGYGNYKEALFTPHTEKIWPLQDEAETGSPSHTSEPSTTV